MFLKGIFGAECVMTMIVAALMAFGGVGSMEAKALSGADGVGARKAATRSGSYPWEGKEVVEVGDAVALSVALGNDGNKGKVIRLTDFISVDGDITSSIDASIDLNGYALNFPDVHSSINVTGGSLNIYDGSGTASSIDVNEDNAKAFVVSDGGTLNIYAGVFTGGGESTAIYNAGAVNVYGGTFSKFKRAIDNVGTLTIEGGNFDGKGGVTGIYNRNVATVSGGTFKTYVMGIYNAGTLKLQALPTVGTGNDANATADIGLKAGKVITMAGEISSLPADYVKIKVGQFSYTERNGDYTAGSAPYVVTSGYKDKVKGIHPAMMFQAYDADSDDGDYYEFCAKSGSGTDVGEAQVVKVGEYDAAIFIDGSQGLTFDLQFCVLQFPENANNAVIKLLRNVDLGSGFVTVDNGSATNPVVIDLNGHLLTGSNNDKVIKVNDGKVLTIRDSGSGGAIVNSNTGFCRSILNNGGTITVEGGSISARYRTVDNSSGMLTVTGGTITGVYNAVYNDGNGTATISSGTFIGATGGDSAIENWGTMSLGCGTAEVKVIADGTSDAVVNRGELTVGKNVTITNSAAAAISTTGNITVDGFPTFDTGTACDIILQQSGDKPAPLIAFTKEPAGWNGNPIKVKIFNNSGKTLPLANEPYTLTSGYAAHVKRGGSGADKDRPQEPGLVFTVLGVADGTYLLLSGGEAVAYAGSFPVAEVKSGDDTYTYNIGTGALGLSTAAGALVQAVYAADRVDDDTTVKMLCDVDLGTAWLDFRTFTSAVGYTPENAKKMTLDLNGFELSGCQINVIDNSVYSLTVVNTGTDGGILQYGADGVCIANYGELTVKGVTLRATGVSGNRIYNFGTLTIDGEMKFLGSVDANDVFLAYGKTLGIGESLNLSAKLKVYVEDATNVPRKLTTGYGTTVCYEATETTPSKVKAPGDVFTVTNIGTNKLAFAGGEAWVVPSGTLALIQTATAVNAYSNVDALFPAVSGLSDDATVMLADDVNLFNKEFRFDDSGKHFTLDLGGHEISSASRQTVAVVSRALLDIIDSGVGGRIINSDVSGFAINNSSSIVSITGGLTIETTGTDGIGISSAGGSLTFNGWPTFVHGSVDDTDIILTHNYVITLADGISGAPAKKISVSYYEDNFGTLTSGYGAHVTYPAGHEKAGEPIDPEEVFTFKPLVDLVASVHPRLIDVNGAAEAEFWMPHQMVAYVDADGNLLDDLTVSTPQTTDDGHDAYILDGTETTLGEDGTDTWYVALPTAENGGYALTKYNQITLNGNVHLILADGAEMKATGDYGIKGNSGYSLTIYGQSENSGKLTAIGTDEYGDGIFLKDADLVINGGNFTLTALNAGESILVDNGNLTVNGGSIFADGEINVQQGSATINGGEFNTSSGGRLYVYIGDITINGGSFYNYDVIAEPDNNTGAYLTFNGGIFEGSNYKIYGKDITTVTGGKINANVIGDWRTQINISLINNDDYIYSDFYFGQVTIPQGSYLSNGENTYGLADDDYVFGEGSNATYWDIEGKVLTKAKPVAASGNYLAYDSSDVYYLLDGQTLSLYPTGVKFKDNNDGTYTAEVILSETPLAGVPKGKPVILAKSDPSVAAWCINFICTNDGRGVDKTPAAIESDYKDRDDILPNFIATDGAKTFAELIGEAAGATVSTAEQARDYLVFTLTGDRFVPITFAYDDTPAAGHCLLVVPKITILLHEDIPAPAGGGSSGARRISLGGGESAATGVNGVIGVGEAKDDTYFGLDGRRLSGRPSQKGVYIRGGSKVVIR